MKVKFYVTIVCLCLGFADGALAQEIRLQGSPSFSFANTDIQPGEGFPSQSETTNNINIDIKKLSKNAYWSVSVNKNDTRWNNQVKVFVRRTSSGTSNGNGSGSVYGGLNYIQINNLSSTFITGNKKMSNIDIQYKITGVDVTLPADDYYTDIVYTLYEN